MSWEVFPDLSAVASAPGLRAIVGALLVVTLIVAVLMTVICASVWAIAAGTGNYRSASRARAGLFICSGAALLAGAGVAIVNFLLRLGAGI